MTRRTMTMPEVRREGLDALRERLGPAGMIRFLQQYEPGTGDYTMDRDAWLEALTVDDITKSIQGRRAR